MNKKKKIVFKTKDFSIISLCIIVITAAVICSNFDFPIKDRTQSEITNGLKLLVEAQNNHKKEFDTYATSFEVLDYKGLLDKEYLSRAKKGYEFRLEYSGVNSFSFTANPQNPSVSNTYYYVDESGVIRYNLNSPASANSSPFDG